MRDSPVVGYNLVMMLSVAAVCGDDETAAYFHGVVRADFPGLARTMAPQQLETHDNVLQRTRQALGDERFEYEASRGARVTPLVALDEAIAYVEKATIGADDATAMVLQSEAATTALTRRQRDVLALLVSGLGNREIGDRLHISPKTVMHHTTAIYQVLGVRGRAEAAVVAVRNGIVE
jgi:DNA-binding NarL/FixJ family response regulator